MKKVQMVGEVFPTDVVGHRWGGEGQTLGDAQAKSENGMLTVGDPYGIKHKVSLAPFAADDPSHYLTFRFITLKERPSFDGLDLGNGVVLKEYEVTGE